MLRVAAWGLVLACAGCNAILSLDNYRACENAECPDADAAADTTTDAPSGNACTKSSDCNAGDGNVVCSNARCTSVIGLSRGMGDFSCAILSDHTARCWGRNSSGQLGNGKTGGWVQTPVSVVDTTGSGKLGAIEDIVTGWSFACAKLTGGTVVCWGTDAAAPGLVPTPILGLTGVKQISAAAGIGDGLGSACAVVSGEARCWGDNSGSGHLGCTSLDPDGGCNAFQPTTYGLVPQKLTSPSEEVAAGTYAVCSAVGGGGEFRCFGNAAGGGMGDGNGGPSCCGTGDANWSANISHIIGSDFYSCLHDSNDEWACWGSNQGGVIKSAPNNAPVLKPTIIAGQGVYFALSVGQKHACAITEDVNAYVKCWGQNDHGQVGTNTQASNVTPVYPVETAHQLSHVVQVAAHRHFTCAINGDGQVYCWGENDNDWLLGSNPSSGDVLEPQPVGWD